MKEERKRILLTIPVSIYDWLEREAKKADTSVQNRIRAVLENNIGKYGHPIFGRKQKADIWDKTGEIAKKFYDVYATERRRLKINEYPYSILPGPNFEFPTFDVTFKRFVSDDGKIIEAPIRDAVKRIVNMENQLLSVCDDGEDVWEGMPFMCQVWYGRGGEFHGILRVVLNSMKTPTYADAEELFQSLNQEK